MKEITYADKVLSVFLGHPRNTLLTRFLKTFKALLPLSRNRVLDCLPHSFRIVEAVVNEVHSVSAVHICDVEAQKVLLRVERCVCRPFRKLLVILENSSKVV